MFVRTRKLRDKLRVDSTFCGRSSNFHQKSRLVSARQHRSQTAAGASADFLQVKHSFMTEIDMQRHQDGLFRCREPIGWESDELQFKKMVNNHINNF